MNDLLATPVPSGADVSPMTVDQVTFLVDRLYEDCSPLQFVRELTQNAIEAISETEDGTGEIRWDVDWVRYDLTEETVLKLCIIDTGCGMTGEEMCQYINKLSSSIHRQHKAGNYGVGAKIAAAPINPHGLVYLSWKDGIGYMIHLVRDQETDQYGLRRFDNNEFWQKIDDDVKPDPIDQHGTMVILLGEEEGHNTIEPPPKTPMPRKWILRYLNGRFFRFPQGVTVKAREGWTLPRNDNHNFLRTVTGIESWLNDSSESSGIVDLEGLHTKVHWWILREDVDLNSGHYPSLGHVGALYQDEVYEPVYGNAGIARLQSFGIVFGCNRVVLYAEPDVDQIGWVTSNTPRTQLLCDNEPLDWAGFAAKFRENMPQELIDYQDTVGSLAKNTDHQTAIRERLKSIRELFRFGRYRPKKGGIHHMAEPVTGSGGNPREGSNSQSGSKKSGGGRGGTAGDIYALFAQNQGEESEEIIGTYEPKPRWVSVDDGTRSSNDEMEDRAAKYVRETGDLLINADFRAFTDMIVRWNDRYASVPGASDTIQDVVREWFEQQLVETIMSAWGLKQGGKWSTEELAKIWTPDALTAAVLPRYHIDMSIKRVLGQKLGKAPAAAA